MPDGFSYVCHHAWDSLAATADPEVRHCGACNHAVHACSSTAEAAAIAAHGGCVALRTGKTITVGEFGDDQGWPRVGWLVVMAGERAGEVIQLASSGVTTVGDAVITGGSIGFYVEPRARSVNVNGESITTRFDLVDNDELVIGELALRFKSIS